jgi:ATP-dependent Clp protease protease subunit
LIATRRMLAGIYETTTKHPIDQILKDIDRDYYMTAEEAREYGLVDQIFNKEMRSGAVPT